MTITFWIPYYFVKFCNGYKAFFDKKLNSFERFWLILSCKFICCTTFKILFPCVFLRYYSNMCFYTAIWKLLSNKYVFRINWKKNIVFLMQQNHYIEDNLWRSNLLSAVILPSKKKIILIPTGETLTWKNWYQKVDTLPVELRQSYINKYIN